MIRELFWKGGIDLNQTDFQLTSRMTTILKNAKKEAQMSKSKVLMPGHLLLACLQEKTGALGEIALQCSLEESSLRSILDSYDITNRRISWSPFLNIDITEDVKSVLEAAHSLMRRYNQIYVNEGHLLKALISSKKVDCFLTNNDKEMILSLGTTSRDLITRLENYVFPEQIYDHIRKVNRNDKNGLVTFVAENFSLEWSETIMKAFSFSEPSIYIAYDHQGEIIGFAAFDIYKNKKGYFGPMGVSLTNRMKGVGYSLLHHCLKEMNEIGYEYAVIGGAGPIEFYERACRAVVIPKYLEKV